MITERLTDPQLSCLMVGILALGLAALLMVIEWAVRQWPFNGEIN